MPRRKKKLKRSEIIERGIRRRLLKELERFIGVHRGKTITPKNAAAMTAAVTLQWSLNDAL